MPSAERRVPSPDVIALTIAGSDSGGGAGIQADLKTFHRFGVFGTSVLTAVTAQNTVGVAGWTSVPTDMIRAQIDAVVSDLRPAAVKSGMLADAAVVRTVAAAIRDHALGPYVLDPVMVATSGDPLLERDAVAAISAELVPLAALVTPNLDEASILLGESVRDEAAMRDAARELVRRLGASAALVKGGHLPGEEMVDVLAVAADDSVHVFRRPKIHTSSTHGTGCTLSSAVTALLARGEELLAAVRQALDFVNRAIATAPGLGNGHGPLNFFA